MDNVSFRCKERLISIAQNCGCCVLFLLMMPCLLSNVVAIKMGLSPEKIARAIKVNVEIVQQWLKKPLHE